MPLPGSIRQTKKRKYQHAKRNTKIKKVFRKKTSVTPKVGLPLHIRRNIEGILNPHKPYRPKHLDGATAESSCHGNRLTSVINIPSGQTGILLLQPDLLYPLIYRRLSTGNTEFLNNTLSDFCWDLNGVSTTPTAKGFINKKYSIDRWRTVSQGIRISLINTTLANDGWFEMYRVNSRCPMDLQQCHSHGGNEGGLLPNDGWLGQLSGAQNKARNSYRSGALKDIKSHKFILRPFGEEHPFINIPHTVEITGTQTYSNPTWQIGENRNLGWHHVADAQHDSTYDSIAIVIYGSADTGGSNILVDVAQNLEVVYENESSLARYHSPTIALPQLTTEVHTANQQNDDDAMATN